MSTGVPMPPEAVDVPSAAAAPTPIPNGVPSPATVPAPANQQAAEQQHHQPTQSLTEPHAAQQIPSQAQANQSPQQHQHQGQSQAAVAGGGVGSGGGGGGGRAGGGANKHEVPPPDVPLGPLDENKKFFLANMAFTWTPQEVKLWFGVSSVGRFELRFLSLLLQLR